MHHNELINNEHSFTITSISRKVLIVRKKKAVLKLWPTVELASFYSTVRPAPCSHAIPKKQRCESVTIGTDPDPRISTSD
jgi:hypothetical protein